MDPKTMGFVALVLTGIATAAGRFLFVQGRSAAIAAAEERIKQLHDEELKLHDEAVAAALTEGTEDDAAVRARMNVLRARVDVAKLALAALRAA